METRVKIKLEDMFFFDGITSFISWKRLEEELKKSGELKKNESIGGVVVSENGIQYFLSKKKK